MDRLEAVSGGSCIDVSRRASVGLPEEPLEVADGVDDPCELPAIGGHRLRRLEANPTAVPTIHRVRCLEAHNDVPMVLGSHLHLNEALGVYVLHAWIFIENPMGVFEDWNPDVHCPGKK